MPELGTTQNENPGQYDLGEPISWLFHEGKIHEVRYEWFTVEGDDAETIS